MGVELGKGDGTGTSHHEKARPQVRADAPLARTTPPPAPYEKREPSVREEEVQGLNPAALGAFNAVWMAAWITAYALLPWQVGFVMMMLQGVLLNYLRRNGLRFGGRRDAIRARRRDRHRELRERRAAPVEAPAAPQPPDPISTAERSLAAAVVRAETAGGRLDAESVELVREVDRLLRPLLANLRSRDADPQVQHDLETLAGEHLPRTIDDYLVLPDDYAHEHRTATGTTPADELRGQLHLLVEGCRQLRDSVLSRDVDRQQQQSRFLESKFRRSDLDL